MTKNTGYIVPTLRVKTWSYEGRGVPLSSDVNNHGAQLSCVWQSIWLHLFLMVVVFCGGGGGGCTVNSFNKQ